VTNGGRVLGITALGNTLQEAIVQAYQAVACISWSGCQFRRDIGAKALRRAAIETPDIKVGIVMGSASDLPVMSAAADFLKKMGIGCEMTVASAHRSPVRATEYASTAAARGLKIIIAGAGMAAHLAGVLSAHTDLPVIGVPLDASSLNGLDALLATVQMPPGIPVATMGIGKAGAKNAAVLATRILALNDPALQRKLVDFRDGMAREVEEAAQKIHVE
jgi:phosphoribosylamine--glycine ligase